MPFKSMSFSMKSRCFKFKIVSVSRQSIFMKSPPCVIKLTVLFNFFTSFFYIYGFFKLMVFIL